jgi:hypothetical protein
MMAQASLPPKAVETGKDKATSALARLAVREPSLPLLAEDGGGRRNMTHIMREPGALMVERSGDARWRRCGKRRGWHESARTYIRSAGSF